MAALTNIPVTLSFPFIGKDLNNHFYDESAVKQAIDNFNKSGKKMPLLVMQSTGSKEENRRRERMQIGEIYELEYVDFTNPSDPIGPGIMNEAFIKATGVIDFGGTLETANISSYYDDSIVLVEEFRGMSLCIPVDKYPPILVEELMSKDFSYGDTPEQKKKLLEMHKDCGHTSQDKEESTDPEDTDNPIPPPFVDNAEGEVEW